MHQFLASYHVWSASPVLNYLKLTCNDAQVQPEKDAMDDLARKDSEAQKQGPAGKAARTFFRVTVKVLQARAVYLQCAFDQLTSCYGHHVQLTPAWAPPYLLEAVQHV